MEETLHNPVRLALDFMEKARHILLEQLTAPGGLNPNVAESLDLLDSACAYASHPDETVPACPACGSIYNEQHGMGYTCLSCDHPWIPGVVR